MKIETKFDENDEVYFLNNNKIKKAKIVLIEIKIYFNANDLIKYQLNDYNQDGLYENQLFKTKQELLDSLSKEAPE